MSRHVSAISFRHGSSCGEAALEKGHGESWWKERLVRGGQVRTCWDNLGSDSTRSRMHAVCMA